VTEMRNRIARAICEAVDNRNPDHLVAVYENRPMEGGGILLPVYKTCWEKYLTAADRVLRAMRDPTFEMVEEGFCHVSSADIDWVEDAWKAMIDAALGETE